MSKPNTKFLDDVPVERRLEMMKHYYTRARNAEAKVVERERALSDNIKELQLRLALYEDAVAALIEKVEGE